MLKSVEVEPAPVKVMPDNNPYLSWHETSRVVTLIGSVNPRTVAEFGVNRGLTANAILSSVLGIETYIGIDVPPDFRTHLDCQRTEVPRVAGQYATYDPRFHLLETKRGSAELGANDLEPIDAAFIDGDHSFEGVTYDARLARSLLRPGGIIVFHDYGNPTVEVTAALDCLAAEGWPLQHVANTWLAFTRN